MTIKFTFKLIAMNLQLYAKPYMPATAYAELIDRFILDLDDGKRRFNPEKFRRVCMGEVGE